MNIFLVLTFLFLLGSVGGFLLEILIRCVFYRKKEKTNLGFLIGPYIPLRGLSLQIIFLISIIDFTFIPSTTLQALFEIVIMAAAIIVLEYVVGIIFIKAFRIKLWDYSDRWGNVQGVICPAYSFLWTSISALYYFFLHSQVIEMVLWFKDHISLSFFLGVGIGIILIDLVLNLSIAIKVRGFAKKHNIVIRYNRLKSSVIKYAKDTKQKHNIVTPFSEELEAKLEYYKANDYAKEKSTATYDIGTNGDIWLWKTQQSKVLKK